ncbi:hypothetical protein MVEG_01793 [Podila verticillata NRRL 6337]|nr:hypothetical protein MVEG_01793 [Podila verticillata NRRL 6337]
MTNPESSSLHQAKGPTRLQLQAACVKAGLDSTPKNDDLKRALQKYWDENNQAERFSLEVNDGHEMNEEANGTDLANVTTTSVDHSSTTTVTTTSTGEIKSQSAAEEEPLDKELDTEQIAVKLEVKLEASVTEQEVVVKEAVIQEQAKDDSERTLSSSAIQVANEDIQEAVEETVVEQEVTVDISIKQEEDVPVKEEAPAEENSLLQPKVEYDDDIKPEDIPAVPVSERAQFWESKASTTTTTTSTPRSGLPVSKTRLANSQRSQTSKVTAQKRMRTEDMDVKKEGSDNNTKEESPSSSLPTPGTVRKMIGRFATSSKRSPVVEPPVAPMSPSKKRRVDSPATSSTSTGPSTPGPSTPVPTTPSKNALKNKVVKIPVATTKAKNVYATPRVVATPTIKKSPPTPKPSETGKAVAARRQKAIVDASEGRPRRTSARLASAPLASSTTTTSTSTTSTTTTATTTSKSVSAETINRLATPKKMNASVISTTIPASFAASVGPAIPTRPRGPVLSTASRAAQRSHRKKD